MKEKTKNKDKRGKKQPNAPVKSSLEALSDYFGSYLSALEMVNGRD